MLRIVFNSSVIGDTVLHSRQKAILSNPMDNAAFLQIDDRVWTLSAPKRCQTATTNRIRVYHSDANRNTCIRIRLNAWLTGDASSGDLGPHC